MLQLFADSNVVSGMYNEKEVGMAQHRFEDSENPRAGAPMNSDPFGQPMNDPDRTNQGAFEQLINDPDMPRYGIPMSEEDFERLISDETDERYELIAGRVYNMTGSSPQHSDLAGQIEFFLRLQLGRKGPCRVHHEQYVAIPGTTPLCPDVVLTCDPVDRDRDKRSKPFRIQSPRLIVEILSPSTKKRDRNYKFARYKTCPTLELYLLVSQDKPLVEVYRRANDWQQEDFAAGQTISLAPLDLFLNIDEIYEGVF
jgi:Uma2 family endonuclease